MRMFYFLIDATCVNAFVLWNMLWPTRKNEVASARLDKQRLFLLEAADRFIRPQIHRRAQDPKTSIQPTIVHTLVSIGENPTPPITVNVEVKRGRYASCPRSKDHKVEHKCKQCKLFVCSSHASKHVVYKCHQCPYESK